MMTRKLTLLFLGTCLAVACCIWWGSFSHDSEPPATSVQFTHHFQGYGVELTSTHMALHSLHSNEVGLPAWQFALQHQGISRLDGTGLPAPHLSAPRTQAGGYDFPQAGGLTIQYRVRPQGLQQNFRLEEKPPGQGSLDVRLGISSDLRPEVSNNELQLRDTSDQVQLRYNQLLALDDVGQQLPAHMVLEGRTLHLIVDDAHATYPILIDPSCVRAEVILSYWQAGSRMGADVAGLGYVNDDSFPDLLIGAPNHQVVYDEGWAFAYYGNNGGIDTVVDALFANDSLDAHYGAAVDGAGDVNGDGFDDALIGAFNYSNGVTQAGAIMVHLGSNNGLDTNWVFRDFQYNPTSDLGHSVAGLGDVNGDGYDDIAAGDPEFDLPNILNSGQVKVYFGAPYGIDTTPGATVLLNGTQSPMYLGYSVCGSDVNGDGFADLMAGAPHYSVGGSRVGAVLVYWGDSTGIDTLPDQIIKGSQAGSWFGQKVAAAGDVNADGYDDLMVSGDGWDNPELSEGAVWVYHGGPNGLDTVAAIRLEKNQVNSFFGHSIAGVGDLNADGYDDVAAGTPSYDTNLLPYGLVAIYLGSPTGISPQSSVEITGDLFHTWFGESLDGIGDINQDGYDDFIVGADQWLPFFYQGQGYGAGLIYYGGQFGANIPTTSHYAFICQGDSAVFPHATYFQPGNYLDTLVGASGCDSLVLVQVAGPNVDTIAFTFSTDSVCQADPPVVLSAMPVGGTFSGPGVSNGEFDPAIAGPGNHWITYVYQDWNGCVFEDSIQFQVDVCTHSEDPISAKLDAYPNPSQGLVRLRGLSVGHPLLLYDFSGRLIARWEPGQDQLRLDLSALEAGAYWWIQQLPEKQVALRFYKL